MSKVAGQRSFCPQSCTPIPVPYFVPCLSFRVNRVQKWVAFLDSLQTAFVAEEAGAHPVLEQARSVVPSCVTCDPSDTWRPNCSPEWKGPLLGSFGYAIPDASDLPAARPYRRLAFPEPAQPAARKAGPSSSLRGGASATGSGPCHPSSASVRSQSGRKDRSPAPEGPTNAVDLPGSRAKESPRSTSLSGV